MELNEFLYLYELIFTCREVYLCSADFNPFDAADLVLYLLKTSENQRLSEIYRGYRKRYIRIHIRLMRGVGGWGS